MSFLPQLVVCCLPVLAEPGQVVLFAVPAPVSFALAPFQSGSICPSVLAVSFQFRSTVLLDFQNFGSHVANLPPIGFAALAFARAVLATVLPLPSLQAMVHEAIYTSSVQMPLLGRQGVPTGTYRSSGMTRLDASLCASLGDTLLTTYVRPKPSTGRFPSCYSRYSSTSL